MMVRHSTFTVKSFSFYIFTAAGVLLKDRRAAETRAAKYSNGGMKEEEEKIKTRVETVVSCRGHRLKENIKNYTDLRHQEKTLYT